MTKTKKHNVLASVFIGISIIMRYLLIPIIFNRLFSIDPVSVIKIALFTLLILGMLLKKRIFSITSASLLVLLHAYSTVEFFIECTIPLFSYLSVLNVLNIIDLLLRSIFDVPVIIMGIIIIISESNKNPTKNIKPLKNICFVFIGISILDILISIIGNFTSDYQISILDMLISIIGNFTSEFFDPSDIPLYLLCSLMSVLFFIGIAFTILHFSNVHEDRITKLKIEMASSNNYSGNYSYSNQAHAAEGYIGLAPHVLLLLLTFGIWDLIWTYKTTKFLNCVEGEEYRNPATKLLLCMFIPFYSIYWTYKSAQRIDKLAAQNGISSDISTLCLILAIFVPIVPPIIMQSKTNEAVTRIHSASQPQAAPYTTATAAASPTTSNTMSVSFNSADLRELKNLLDAGIITQDEFDAKKKQILGL